jgi:hypothetical protein
LSGPIDRGRLPLLEDEDLTGEAVIEPSRLIRPVDTPPVAVACFFRDVVEELSGRQDARSVCRLHSEMGPASLWEIEHRGVLPLPGDGRRLAGRPGVAAPWVDDGQIGAPAVVRLGRGRRRRVDEVTGFQMQRYRPGRSSKGCRIAKNGDQARMVSSPSGQVNRYRRRTRARRRTAGATPAWPSRRSRGRRGRRRRSGPLGPPR